MQRKPALASTHIRSRFTVPACSTKPAAPTTVSRDAVIAEYNDAQKAGCEAWGVDLLLDVFPQADEFEIPKYSPVWAYAKPAEFDEIGDQLDEIAWSSLISCIIGSEDQFDANYDEMLAELEGVGMADAEAMLTEIVKREYRW